MPPIEPPPSSWDLTRVRARPGEDLVAAGGDLEPGTVLAAYRNGLFPMGLGDHGGPPIGWWSPDPRGILRPGDLRLSRSLRRSARRFEVTADTAFDAVVAGCADPGRPGAWITPDIQTAYGRLHNLGWAHSVEVWSDGQLVGGLYGLGIGGLFAGESMFHRATDASKVALMGLVAVLRGQEHPDRLIDVQWRTDHLAALGVREVPREAYLDLVRRALAAPDLCWPDGGRLDLTA